MSFVLQEMMNHNRWANMQTAAACARLTSEQLAHEIQGGFGSIRATIEHILSWEEWYAATILGAEPPSDSGTPETWVDRMSASGDAMLNIALDATDDRPITGDWGSGPFTKSLSIYLVQCLEHAAEHRAHIAVGLSTIGIAPPDVSAWAYSRRAGATRTS